MSYDRGNLFAKMLRGEVPVERLYEDDYAIAFHDKYPDAPVHVLVIPKGAYSRYHDFLERADTDTIAGFFRAVKNVAQQLGLSDYRLATNNGEKAGQVIHHFHVHILAGKPPGTSSAQ